MVLTIHVLPNINGGAFYEVRKDLREIDKLGCFYSKFHVSYCYAKALLATRIWFVLESFLQRLYLTL